MGTGKTIALLQSADGGSEQFIVRAMMTDTGACLMDKTDAEIYAAFEKKQQVACDVYDQTQSFLCRLPLIAVHAVDTNRDGLPDAFQSSFSAIIMDRVAQLNSSSTQNGANGTTNQTVTGSVQPLPLADAFQWSAITGKPFHTGAGAPLFPPMSYDASGGEVNVVIAEPFQLEVGKEYIVTINGASFSTICEQLSINDYSYVISNMSESTSEPADDIQFQIINVPSGADLGAGTLAYGVFTCIPVSSSFTKGTFSVSRPGENDLILNADSLPAMTAASKGGAIAGEGLVMEGDVLKVDMDTIIAQVKAALNS